VKEVTMSAPEDPRGDGQALREMYQELVWSIRDHNISKFLDFCLGDRLDGMWEDFITAPGARTENPGHHAFKGGLAYHTLTAAKVASQIVDHYRSLGMSVNKDIVIAGIILHDIGKVWSYEWLENRWKAGEKVGPGYSHTEASKLHHHIPIGFSWFMREAERFNTPLNGVIPKHTLTEKKINHIGHIILSHHGRRSWSSPVVPKTVEAYIVHVVEMMDAYVDKYNKGQDVRDLYDH